MSKAEIYLKKLGANRAKGFNITISPNHFQTRYGNKWTGSINYYINRELKGKYFEGETYDEVLEEIAAHMEKYCE